MAKKVKALIGFQKMKDDELVMLTNTVILAMTNNPNYPAPTPDLGSIQSLLDDFSSKLASSRKRGSPEDTALKDESAIPLRAALQKLAYYVNAVADGHLSTLLSSGFPTNSPINTSVIPLKVANVKLADGRQSGQIRLEFGKQRNVRIYEYCYRQVGEHIGEWSERLTTTSSRGNIIAPLVPGLFYEVRVRAINSQGTGDWSDTARLLAR